MAEQIEEDKPFFCYLPYNAPHTPGLVPDEYWKPYYDKWVGRWESVIYGMVKSIDDRIARVLSLLERSGQQENTIVIFMTDNGPNTWRYNAGLRGRKGHVYEGGIRVPCFIRWKGVLEPHLVDRPLAHIDILPTLADLCGFENPVPENIDGKSFVGLLWDPKTGWLDRKLISFSHRDAKRIREDGAVHTERWTAVQQKGAWQLYDMQKDLRQFHDVADRFPETVRELSNHFETTLSTMPELGTLAPVPIGHKASPQLVLKGHEAILSPKKGQGIDFNYPAAFTGHWISDWNDTDAYPSWSLNVVGEGVYEVMVWCCLPEDGLGVKGYLEIGEQRLPFSVDEAFDPDPFHQPFMLDNESNKYESKPWKRLPIGEIGLKKGDSVARIRLTKIPGNQSLEVKEIELKRTL